MPAHVNPAGAIRLPPQQCPKASHATLPHKVTPKAPSRRIDSEKSNTDIYQHHHQQTLVHSQLQDHTSGCFFASKLQTQCHKDPVSKKKSAFPREQLQQTPKKKKLLSGLFRRRRTVSCEIDEGWHIVDFDEKHSGTLRKCRAIPDIRSASTPNLSLSQRQHHPPISAAEMERFIAFRSATCGGGGKYAATTTATRAFPHIYNHPYAAPAYLDTPSTPSLVSHSRSTSDTSTFTTSSMDPRLSAASVRARKYSAKQAALLARPPCPPPSYPIPNTPVAQSLRDIPDVRASGIYFGADLETDEPTLYCITPQDHARSFARR